MISLSSFRLSYNYAIHCIGGQLSLSSQSLISTVVFRIVFVYLTRNYLLTIDTLFSIWLKTFRAGWPNPFCSDIARWSLMAWLRPSVWRSRSWPRSPEPGENHAVLKVGAEPRQLRVARLSQLSRQQLLRASSDTGRLARPRSRPGNQSMWGGHWQWTDNRNHVGTHENTAGEWACQLSMVISMILRKESYKLGNADSSHLKLIVFEVGLDLRLMLENNA